MGQRRIILAISGASGASYGVRLLELLREQPLETHLVVSPSGWINIAHETGRDRAGLEALADFVHDPRDVGATIASGSFGAAAMIVAPCSMKTLASIAHSFADNLIARAADVILKERRRLVLMVRETPLHLGHLRNMSAATEMGAVIFPPVPALYHRPQTIAEMIDHACARALALLDIEVAAAAHWSGLPEPGTEPAIGGQT